MWVVKLSNGVLRVLTPLGPRYIKPAFKQRLQLLWAFRHFEVLPLQVLSPRQRQLIEGEMLQGTLDLLILQTLVLGPAHGHTIAHAIEHRSEDVLQVEHGSLYPALHRLEDRGWIASFWGTSENNRKARYYRLSAAGRKQLIEQTGRWDRLVQAVNRVLRPAEK